MFGTGTYTATASYIPAPEISPRFLWALALGELDRRHGELRSMDHGCDRVRRCGIFALLANWRCGRVACAASRRSSCGSAVAVWIGRGSGRLHADVVMRWRRRGADTDSIDRWVNHAAGLRVFVLVSTPSV
jgi:hypothetical protein